MRIRPATRFRRRGLRSGHKRYREIGSSIACINCITEAELRTQVDNMTQYRDDMRNKSGKCTWGVGCSGGG